MYLRRNPLHRLVQSLALVLAFAAATAEARGASREPVFSSPRAAAQYYVMVGEMAAGRDMPEMAVAQFLRALDYVPDAELASRTTRLALIAGNEPLALTAARRWQELAPADLTAREAVARLSLRAGDTETARIQCEAIITSHPGGVEDGFREVALLLSHEAERGDPALAIMERLRQSWPDSPGAWYAQGLLALRFNRIDLAESSARQSLQLQGNSQDARLLLTGILVRKGDLEGADRVFAGLLKDSEDAVDLRLGYARLLLEAEQSDAAREQFKAILARNPKHHESRYALGLLELERQKPEAAEPHFRALLEAPLLREQAAYYLGRIHEVQNRPAEALEWYRKVTHGEQMLDASIRQGILLGKMGRVEEGRSLLVRLRQQLPTLSTRFYLAEGELLLNADATDEALAMYEAALREAPEDDDLLYGRSLVHERLRNVPKAEADLRKILEKDPDDARSLNALGYMLTVHTDRLSEARGLIERALELTPEDAAVIDSMGWVEFRMGNVEQARTLLERAFGKLKDPEIAAHLGEVLWQLGEKDRARSIWEEALENDPDHRVLRETVNRFSR